MSFGNTRFIRAAAALGAGLALFAGLLGTGGQAQAGIPQSLNAAAVSKIDPSVLQETADGKAASVIVLLADQADVSSAHAMRDQDARGWFVYNTLRQHAERTQAGLRTYLKAQGVSFRTFWAANMIEVTANRALLESLAARADVAKIDSNRPTRWIEKPEVANHGVTQAPVVPGAIEWGVQRVNAPQVWAMGFRGDGMVVGGLDTGIRWTHLAIKNQYRGWDGANANHNYNWWDAIHSGGGVCGPNTQQPCDDNGHGTHTVGTAVGSDGGANEIGVAPNAKWVGCRNMNVGNGTPATYTECFQFMIAPTDLAGQNANPALRPHVLINSWGCPPSEGCTGGDELRVITENTQAAGIFVQASAGNSGSSCGSVSEPIAMYEATFSTGATDINNNLASFSSRGPVTRDGSNRLKPNISAPGVNVRSATRSSDTAYTSLSGTSMAGPHVSGVVALLWNARPALVRDINATKNVLQNSANPQVNVSAGQPYCGGTPPTQIPNNYFGYGRVDALAAVNSVSGGTPTPTGTGTPPTSTRTSTSLPPTNTALPTATTDPCLVSNYLITTAAGTIVPGTTNIGSSCDDCVTTVTIPFPFRLYDQLFTSAQADSNGKLHFPTGASVFTNSCLPQTGATYTIYPYWDDLRTDGVGGTCPAGGCGIFTSVTGTAPNRIFNIEWRAVYFTGGGTANFEVRLYETPTAGSASYFEVVYGTLTNSNTSATGGVQRNATIFTQDFCDGAGGPAAGVKQYRLLGCATVSPTVIATSVSTLTAIPTTTSSTPTQPVATRTSTSIIQPTITLPAATGTAINTAVSTVTVPAATGTVPAATGTAVSTGTPGGATSTVVASTATSTACTQSFTDVQPTDTFYPFIRCLACRGIIGGYADGTFRPNNNITRGQIAKMVSNSAGFQEPISGQTFEDVPPASPFYVFIERLFRRGHMGGYPCGQRTTETCIPPENRPYFRPNEDATRGQLSKIVSNAAGYTEPHTGQFYTDVTGDNPFYLEIMRLTTRGAMSGYPCGGPGEPCDPQNRPYFRWANPVTRGQASKIVANTFFPNCQTPR
jgi:serine protease AprX